MEDFAVPAKHRMKIKENEVTDNYLDLARELKKKENRTLRVMDIRIAIGAFGTVSKDLVKGLE